MGRYLYSFIFLFCLLLSSVSSADESLLSRLDRVHSSIIEINRGNPERAQQDARRVLARYGPQLSAATAEMARSVMQSLQNYNQTYREGLRSRYRASTVAGNLRPMLEKFERLVAYNSLYGANKNAGLLSVSSRQPYMDTIMRMATPNVVSKGGQVFVIKVMNEKGTVRLSQKAYDLLKQKSGFNLFVQPGSIHAPNTATGPTLARTYPNRNPLVRTTSAERLNGRPVRATTKGAFDMNHFLRGVERDPRNYGQGSSGISGL